MVYMKPVAVQTATLLTSAQLAARWGVDIKTIYDGIRLGQIPAVRIGRRVLRVALAVVERIENDGHVEPPEDSHVRSA
jgi:hypothetical protein